MSEEILKSVYSQESRRHAMLADDGVTGILYLHAPTDDPGTTGEVEATSFAYIRIEPIDPAEVSTFRPRPPPISIAYAAREAVCREPSCHQWELTFSVDGTSILLTKNGQHWALASINYPRGLSKAIQSHGPWGSPWSESICSALEWTKRNACDHK